MFKLIACTPEEVVYQGEVISVIVPGGEGYLEVLLNHAPLITTLKPGTVTITDKEKKKTKYRVTNGMFEFSNNKATILADHWSDIKIVS